MLWIKRMKRLKDKIVANDHIIAESRPDSVRKGREMIGNRFNKKRSITNRPIGFDPSVLMRNFEDRNQLTGESNDFGSVDQKSVYIRELAREGCCFK